MAKQTINTIKNWFRTGSKPTQAQFWDWLDSFFHKDDNIPSAQVEGLQTLLDAKVDKKDLTSNKGVWDPDKAYVFDANQAQYVSFVNPDSTDDFFTTERWFRLDADTTAGQSPETSPEKWVHIGEVLGDVAIEDVLGLRAELDWLAENAGSGSQERFSLIGHTTIPTAFAEARQITGVPSHLNLDTVKLVKISDSSEIAILTAGTLETMPIDVAAGEYNYQITYESGKESGVLLINYK